MSALTSQLLTMILLVCADPMLLDPNTASPKLIVSEDLTALSHTEEEEQKRPDNPERLHIGVLGSKGFTTGLHCWDVDVGDNDSWALGVVKQSAQNKRGKAMQLEDDLWSIYYMDGKYCAGTTAWTELTVDQQPRIIRISLNCERGELSFLDLDAIAPLYTFTNVSKEALFPYFNTTSSICPLRLCFPKHACDLIAND